MKNGRLKNRIDAEIILSSTPVGRSVDCCLEMDSHSPYSKEKSLYSEKGKTKYFHEANNTR